MSYDLWLYIKPKPTCEHCGRSDPEGQLTDFNMTYNHGWAFYEFLDSEKGIRGVYRKSLKYVVPEIADVLESLTHLKTEGEDLLTDWTQNYKNNKGMIMHNGKMIINDGWPPTVGNTYLSVERLYNASLQYLKEYPDAYWNGD